MAFSVRCILAWVVLAAPEPHVPAAKVGSAAFAGEPGSSRVARAGPDETVTDSGAAGDRDGSGLDRRIDEFAELIDDEGDVDLRRLREVAHSLPGKLELSRRADLARQEMRPKVLEVALRRHLSRAGQHWRQRRI